jgi:hypothetical protein
VTVEAPGIVPCPDDAQRRLEPLVGAGHFVQLMVLTPMVAAPYFKCVATVVRGDFEWDAAKAAANLIKHGVSFEEAITAFEDPRHVLVDDGAGNGGYVLIGFSLRGRLLTVVHVERGPRERIVSAWLASAKEERVYARR